MDQINPLKQYFRRPALYIRLPSGGVGYAPDAIDLPDSGEIPIYPMTTIDEITSRTPDALFNGVAVAEIIKSCVPNIKDPWSIPVTDIDALLVAIRSATIGDKMEIETVCTNDECKQETKYDVALPILLSNYVSGDYQNTTTIGELIIKFRPLNFKEVNESNIKQFEMQKMMMSIENIENVDERNAQTSDLIIKLNTITKELITASIEFIKTPEATVFDKNFILDFLNNCDVKTFNAIKEKNIELRESSETKPLKIKCNHCGNEYDQVFNINVSTFFD